MADGWQSWQRWTLGCLLMVLPLAYCDDAPPALVPRILPVPLTDGGELPLYWFAMPAANDNAPRPMVLLIHGGGWSQGTPQLLFDHARHFAQQGAVGVVLSYRLTNKTDRGLGDCLADIRTQLAWLRAHAAELGGDAKRLTLVGESAGGHLAAGAALLPDPATGKAPLAEDLPAALILLNPVLDIRSLGWRPTAREFTGLPAGPLALDGPGGQLSPSEFVRPKLPPTLILHGLADKVVPVAASQRFATAMRTAGNACTLQELPETGHAFAIPGYGKPEQVQATLLAMDHFLAALGLLPAPTP